jgi:hypothetical protein
MNAPVGRSTIMHNAKSNPKALSSLALLLDHALLHRLIVRSGDLFLGE